MDAHGGEPPLIVAAGMDFEARIARGPGIEVVYGQKRDTYARELDALARKGARGVLSFGTAGGLSPELVPGDVVIASSIVTRGAQFLTHAGWSKAILEALANAHNATIFGAEAPVLTVRAKRELWKATGAAAVDMESCLAAQAATQYGLPLAVLRIVIDPADRSIPQSALAGVREDGTTNIAGVLRSLIQRPRDIGPLIRLAGDSRKANKSLFSCRQTLGPSFGFLNLLEFPFHVK